MRMSERPRVPIDGHDLVADVGSKILPMRKELQPTL